MLDRDAVERQYVSLGKQIRSGQFPCVRPEYALALAHSVRIAQCAGIDRITVVELGVAGGRGLVDLCDTADVYSRMFNIEFDIVGFDIASGMPDAIDYRDHPEIWYPGQFDVRGETNDIHERLAGRAQLIVGNVSETVPEFVAGFGNSVLGFVSIDLDHYSATKNSMALFDMPAENYLPAVPVFVDDINTAITYNPWQGEALAINEFNNTHLLRKIEEKHQVWQQTNFHVLHLFDHPMRTGAVKMPYPLDYGPF